MKEEYVSLLSTKSFVKVSGRTCCSCIHTDLEDMFLPSVNVNIFEAMHSSQAYVDQLSGYAAHSVSQRMRLQRNANVSRNAQYNDVNRKTIENQRRTFILKRNNYLVSSTE